MRYKSVIGGVIVIMGILALFSERFFSSAKKKNVKGSVYDFRIKGLDGTPVDFARYRGKHLLIVNTASKCGYTPQYEPLQKLHEMYGDKVAVLGFPANNFLWQEPGSNEEIASFCQKNYGVTFQMFEKISVSGGDQHPLYQWLTAKAGKRPTWNFCKYLIDQDGRVADFYGPKVSPLDEAIINQIAN